MLIKTESLRPIATAIASECHILLQDFVTYFEPARVIHIQYLNSGPSNGREAIDPRSFKHEVFGPRIPARMEKTDNLTIVKAIPARFGPLCRLQRWHASARLSGSSDPPCCLATTCSTWCFNSLYS